MYLPSVLYAGLKESSSQSFLQCHVLSGCHGNEDEAEAEDGVRPLLHGLPAGPRLCSDAAWW